MTPRRIFTGRRWTGSNGEAAIHTHVNEPSRSKVESDVQRDDTFETQTRTETRVLVYKISYDNLTIILR